jgi:REP element-mobilizing transposase RayT
MHRLLRDAWELHDDYPVGRYVIMPEHIHLFVGEKQYVLRFLTQLGRQMEATRHPALASV